MAATGSEKKPGKAGMIVTMAVLTVLGIGGGALVGKLVAARFRAATPPPATVAAAVPPAPYSGETEVRELPPIVTNLADVGGTSVRLQVAIVYTKKAVDNPPVLMARINDDLVAFLKTLSLAQLQGASGLQNLREDLNERAAVRSQGGVREVIIETLVTQ